MKTLLFLGAGASTQYNDRMPTEFSFLKHYLDQRTVLVMNSGFDAGKGFDQYGDYGFQTYIEKFIGDCDNKNVGISKVYARRDSFTTQPLEQLISVLVMKGISYAPKSHYQELINFCHENKTGIATTNWDLCIESVLGEEGYSYPGLDVPRGTPIWKLQGSLSWQIHSHVGGFSHGAGLQVGARLKANDEFLKIVSIENLKKILNGDQVRMGLYAENGIVYRPLFVCYDESEVPKLETIKNIRNDFLNSVGEVETLVTIGYRFPNEDLSFLKDWQKGFNKLRKVYSFVKEFENDPKEIFTQNVETSAPLGYFNTDSLETIKKYLLE